MINNNDRFVLNSFKSLKKKDKNKDKKKDKKDTDA